jgi:hypothetical protein
MHLPRQLGPLHDLLSTPEAYDAVLADVVEQALARLTPEGNLEHPDADDDIGDTSLGVTSLLALAWQRAKDPRLPEAVRHSLAFHLRERVYTEDNPGYPNLTVRNSRLPYARYVLEAGAHPIGDCPSTVWALLQAVNILDLADGLVDDGQRTELVELGRGYWRWLTEATFFNPQEAGNQAIGCVVGGLMLARHLPPEEGEPVRERALALYTDRIRAHRVLDRGVLLPPEHGGAYDNNYGPISLSFLAQAHRISGVEMFAEDGDALARYLDARLPNGGFDNGGPRYSEQHSGFESVLGLRYFGARIGSDLGRYRGDTRWGRHAVGPDGGIDGHFAWMLVWQIKDATRWHRTPSRNPARHQLRAGTVSVAFDQRMTPSLVEAAGTYYLPAAVNRQHGFGPVVDGFLLSRPMGEVRVRDLESDGLSAKLVTKPVVGRDHAATRPVVVCHRRRESVDHGRRRTPRRDAVPARRTAVRHRRRGPGAQDRRGRRDLGRPAQADASTSGRRGPLRRPLRDDPGAGGVRPGRGPARLRQPGRGLAPPRRLHGTRSRTGSRRPAGSARLRRALRLPGPSRPHLRRHTGGPDDPHRGVHRADRESRG